MSPPKTCSDCRPSGDLHKFDPPGTFQLSIQIVTSEGMVQKTMETRTTVTKISTSSSKTVQQASSSVTSSSSVAEAETTMAEEQVVETSSAVTTEESSSALQKKKSIKKKKGKENISVVSPSTGFELWVARRGSVVGNRV